MSFGLFGLTSLYTRRQAQKDVFFNDPFKIQSYNFRYADRPAYPMQHYQRPPQPSPAQQPKPPNFETYYRNPKFITSKSTNATSATASSNAFAEHRRRQFLQDFNCFSTPMPYQAIPTATAPQRYRQSTPISNNTLLRICCNSEKYQTIRRDHSVSTLGQSPSSSSKTSPVGGSFLKQPARNFTTSTFKRIASGCPINLNMSACETKTELSKRLSVQIETDNNTNNFEVQTNSNPVHSSSSNTFFIDKRLSKFNVPPAPSTNCGSKQQQVLSEQDQLHQLKQQIEQHKIQMREREREHLLEVQRLREVERETLRKRLELEAETQQRLLTSTATPAPVSTLHLGRRISKDRLPSMAPFNIQQIPAGSEPIKPPRQEDQIPITPQSAPPARALERRSSHSSSTNASVCGCASNASLHYLSNPRPSERKLLNLYGNSVPVSYNQPIHTRINNLPIRITSSQAVRPPGQETRFSPFRLRNNGPYNVNINVYADNLRSMRL